MSPGAWHTIHNVWSEDTTAAGGGLQIAAHLDFSLFPQRYRAESGLGLSWDAALGGHDSSLTDNIGRWVPQGRYQGAGQVSPEETGFRWLLALAEGHQQ